MLVSLVVVVPVACWSLVVQQALPDISMLERIPSSSVLVAQVGARTRQLPDKETRQSSPGTLVSVVELVADVSSITAQSRVARVVVAVEKLAPVYAMVQVESPVKETPVVMATSRQRIPVVAVVVLDRLGRTAKRRRVALVEQVAQTRSVLVARSHMPVAVVARNNPERKVSVVQVAVAAR